MKIGTDAVEVLKNFAEINSNLWIPEGHRIRTMNVAKTCLAEAMLTEGFERDVGIYDLKQFLGVLSIHEEPEIDLDETFMTIRDLSAKSRTRYWYAAREIVFSPPAKDLAVETPEERRFVLTAGDLERVLRSSRILQNPEVALRSAEGMETVEIISQDSAVDTKHNFSVNVGTVPADYAFDFRFKIENLKLIETDYEVSLNAKRLAQFRGRVGEAQVTYWVPAEKESTGG